MLTVHEKCKWNNDPGDSIFSVCLTSTPACFSGYKFQAIEITGYWSVSMTYVDWSDFYFEKHKKSQYFKFVDSFMEIRDNLIRIRKHGMQCLNPGWLEYVCSSSRAKKKGIVKKSEVDKTKKKNTSVISGLPQFWRFNYGSNNLTQHSPFSNNCHFSDRVGGLAKNRQNAISHGNMSMKVTP